MTDSNKSILAWSSVILIAFIFMTLSRNYVWTEDLIWKDSIRKSPELPGPHLNLAVWYHSIGNQKAEFRELQAAARLASKRLTTEPNPFRSRDILVTAQSNLGVLFMKNNDLKTAEQALRGSLSLMPYFGPASINLSNLLIMQERYPEALTIIDDALIHRNWHAVNSEGKLLQNKGIALTLMGDCTNAQLNFDKASKVDRFLPLMQCQ